MVIKTGLQWQEPACIKCQDTAMQCVRQDEWRSGANGVTATEWMRDVGGVWSDWHSSLCSSCMCCKWTIPSSDYICAWAQHGQLTGLLTFWTCMEVNGILVDREILLILEIFSDLTRLRLVNIVKCFWLLVFQLAVFLITQLWLSNDCTAYLILTVHIELTFLSSCM